MATAFLLTATIPEGRGFTDLNDDQRLTVTLPDFPDHPVAVKVPKDGGEVTAQAGGFMAEDDAREAAEQIQSALRAASITAGVIIDVGTVPTPRGRLASHVKQAMEQRAADTGQQVQIVDHVHGVQVFEDRGVPITYATMEARGQVTVPFNRFAESLTLEASRFRPVDPKMETARDLYMAAERATPRRSTFIILITALEVLIRRQPRSTEMQAHISALIDRTSQTIESVPNREEFDALIQTLNRERDQSITSALRDLAASTSGSGLDDDSATRRKKMGDYYNARSKIVHDGTEPRDFNLNAATNWVRSLVRALVLPDPAS